MTGFVDGEGCFSIGFIKQPDKQEKNRIRRGYKMGYQIFYEFAVTQSKSSIESLQVLKDFFGIGKIYLNKRYDNHKEHLCRYVVRKRKYLLDVIIPFFKKYPLRTTKQKDFEKFASCLSLIQQNEHLKLDGMIRIVKIVSTMNRRKPRESLIRILRDYTPNPAKAGMI
ncbi:MAG: LAGLIDADG family homing endonuclease [Candidatus Woesebacteria bacterium]|nr:LAGLIDADG family homing endonuclease [Candidatus Woesebacteria bacterium]